MGRLVEVTDPFDRVNATVRLRRPPDPGGPELRPLGTQNDQNEFNIVTAYDYDPVGNLVEDGHGRSDHALWYDAANRLVRTTDPFGNISQFTYDDTGNLTA